MEIQAEIEKFQKKVHSGLEEYTYVNQKTKADIIEAKRTHDQLMDQLIITTIVCQTELFNQAASQLEAIIATMPEDKVLHSRIYRNLIPSCCADLFSFLPILCFYLFTNTPPTNYYPTTTTITVTITIGAGGP